MPKMALVELRHELASTPHADLFEDGFAVVLHCVSRNVACGGDLRCCKRLCYKARDLALPWREAIGLNDEWGDLHRLGPIQDYSDLARLTAGHTRRVNGQPFPPSCPHPNAGLASVTSTHFQLTESCCHRGHGPGEPGCLRVYAVQVLDQPLCDRGHGDDGEVVGQQHEARAVVLQRRLDRVPRDGGAKTNRDMRRNTCQERLLGWAEPDPCSLTVQTEYSPTCAVDHQSGSELVTKGSRLQDFPVAPACSQDSAGTFQEAAHVPSTPGKLGKLVCVILEKFILEEQRRLTAQDIIDHGTGEQECGWIGGGEKGSVDRDDSFQRPQDFASQDRRIQAPMREPHDVLTSPLSLDLHDDNSL